MPEFDHSITNKSQTRKQIRIKRCITFNKIKTVVNKLIINTAPKTNQIPQSKSIHFTNTYYVLEMKQQVRN